MNKWFLGLAPIVLVICFCLCFGRLGGDHAPFEIFSARGEDEPEAVDWDAEHFGCATKQEPTGEPSKVSFIETIDLLAAPSLESSPGKFVLTRFDARAPRTSVPETMPPCTEPPSPVPDWMPYVTDKDN
jgi:hypothetical protein